MKGRVLVALADGTVAIFHRDTGIHSLSVPNQVDTNTQNHVSETVYCYSYSCISRLYKSDKAGVYILNK